MLRTGIAAGAALVMTCAFGVTPESGARPAVRGTGFQVASRLGVTAVSPVRPYTVTFGSAGLKTRYTPYLTAAARQLREAGVRIRIGGGESVAADRCPPRGHIHYTQAYRPVRRGGYSLGLPCTAPPDGVAAGGVVTMDSEYFDGTWDIAPYKLRNTFVHELLHTLGLDHPNRDLDGDGTAGPYECVTGPGGVRPVMCSPNGGHRTPESAGRLTRFDLDGVRALLANAQRQGAG
ncbi:hypothetical protein [Streptomyces nanshensis]|nr:hypothetical protein [Streptomyces nanshensis]